MPSKQQALSFCLVFLKGVGIAILSALSLELLFALIIKLCALSSACILPVNQCIKAVSIFLGVFFSVKERAVLMGGLIGAVGVVLTKVVFSFLAGGSFWELESLFELLFGLIVGILSAIIAIITKR